MPIHSCCFTTSPQPTSWSTCTGSSRGYALSPTRIRSKSEPEPRYHGSGWPPSRPWPIDVRLLTLDVINSGPLTKNDRQLRALITQMRQVAAEATELMMAEAKPKKAKV